MYSIAFLCLLRIDEVLRIQLRNIRVHDTESRIVELMLDFRKTHQTGGKVPYILTFILLLISIIDVQPFFLYENRQEPWLNVPWLLFDWLLCSGITEGYLFLPFLATDQVKIILGSAKLVRFRRAVWYSANGAL
jgi:hypothetical protein